MARSSIRRACDAFSRRGVNCDVIVRRIISGAQTGADRGALDAALELGLETGGWVPRGRKAEDGAIPDHYPNLRETHADDYETRTRWNVRDSDATLILSHGPLTGGSAFTESIARSLGKPVLHIDLASMTPADAAATIRAWLAPVIGGTLNVAGPRASHDPAIHAATKEILLLVLR